MRSPKAGMLSGADAEAITQELLSAAPGGDCHAPADSTGVKGGADKRVRPAAALGFFLFFFAVSCGFAGSQEMIARCPGPVAFPLCVSYLLDGRTRRSRLEAPSARS